jgi:hypothetical protein
MPSSRYFPCDLADFTLSEGEVFAPKRRSRRRPFLRGPVPMDWLARAYRLSANALFVGLVLWHRAGLSRSRTVEVNQRNLGFELNAQAVRRALRALEAEGLIRIRQRPGRKLRVRIWER